MKKKEESINYELKNIDNQDLSFFNGIIKVIDEARKFVGQTADLTMCATYFEMGRMIIEREQHGKERADYGKKLISNLSEFLTTKYGKGFSISNVKNSKQFYLAYRRQITQLIIDNFNNSNNNQKSQTVFSLFKTNELKDDYQVKMNDFNYSEFFKNASLFFKVGWSHYLILMRIKNEQERQFYEVEAYKQNWSFKQLQRQYGSSLYERLALSRNKNEVIKLASEGQAIEKSKDVLKSPLILEFLGMQEKSEYAETDLEQAIINKLSDFLLELGKGFLFESRQRRFTFDEDNFYIDLVFYNRLLQCYILVDLKTAKLKHQDVGQMQMYVNYFDRYIKKEYEKPTIGILLCREKNDSVVELTLPKDANIYASEYSFYLPDKKLLQSKLAEWIAEFEETKNSIIDEKEVEE